MTGQGIKSFDEPSFNRREILRYAQCPGCTDETLIALMEECIAECRKYASFSYRVSYSVLLIDTIDAGTGRIVMNGLDVTSRDLAGNLKGCTRVIIFAASIGPGIDRLIKKYTKLDPVKALFMQAIGAERVETLCDMFCRSFDGRLRPRFSPGFGDLALSLQPDVLRITNATKNLSITLDEGFLMSPTKSVTAFVGVEDMD